MESAAKTQKAPLTRFGEFEFLKALAILGLPFVHILESALEIDAQSKGLVELTTPVIGLCVFGPSVFMICMGFGIGGGKTSYKSIRDSGIQFLLIGFLLNIVRWFIPGCISAAVIHTNLMEDITYCLTSDIYYFVGLFFIFYAYTKKFKIPTTTVVVISLGTLTVNNALTPIIHEHVTNPIASAILGNMIYVDYTSCFPFMSWLIFPMVGVVYGEILKKSTEEYRAEFMRKMISFSSLGFIAFTFFLWSYDIDIYRVLVSPENDYITDLPNVIMLVLLANNIIGITYFLCRVIGNSRFMEFMLRISAFIIPFYLLQWVIISWIFYGYQIFRIPPHSFGIMEFIISSVLVMAVCIWVSLKYGMKIMKLILKITTFKKKRKKKGAGKTVQRKEKANEE